MASTPLQESKAQDNILQSTTPKSTSKTGSRRYVPIGALNPYGAFTIKAKISAKYPMREINSNNEVFKVFSVELVDQEGSKMEATFWREQAEKYDKILEVGQVYMFSKFKVKLANRKYSRVDEDYKIDFNASSEIELCKEAMEEIKEKLKYVSFDKLGKYIGRNTQIDVLGIILEIGEEATVKRKSDGEELKRRDIKLLDKSGLTINMTVWSGQCEELQEVAKKVSSDDVTNATVVSVSCCIVSEFNGASLNTSSRSKIAINPTNEIASELKAWYKNSGKDVTTKTVAESLGTANRQSRGTRERQLLSQANQELSQDEVQYCSIICAVSQVDPDSKMFYQAAPADHKRKVVEQGSGEYYCEFDKKTYSEFQWGYALQVQLMDMSGSAQVSLLNEQAEILLGISANNLKKLQLEDENIFRRTIQDAQWKEWDVLIQKKMREYKGERRLRLSVSRLSPVNFQMETTTMTQKCVT